MANEYKLDYSFISQKINEIDKLLVGGNSFKREYLEREKEGLCELLEQNKHKGIFEIIELQKISIQDIENKLNKIILRYGRNNLEALYYYLDDYSFIYKTYHLPDVNKKNKKIVNETLKFYSSFDKGMYKLINRNISDGTIMIDMSPYNKESFYYWSQFLNKRFVKIKKADNMSECALIHELAHIYKDMEYGHFSGYFDELGSIFSETIYIDENLRNDLYGKAYYLKRVNSINNLASIIKHYVKFILLFEDNNCHIDINMTNEFKEFFELDIKDEELLNKIYKIDIDEDLTYIVSFFKMMDIREEYYTDKKLAIRELKHCMSTDQRRDISIISNSKLYDNYIKGIENIEGKSLIKVM